MPVLRAATALLAAVSNLASRFTETPKLSNESGFTLQLRAAATYDILKTLNPHSSSIAVGQKIEFVRVGIHASQ